MNRKIRCLIRTQWLCRWGGLFLILIAIGYTLWYLSFSDPMKSYGALSYIGLKHPVLFAIWGLLAESALYLNIKNAYRQAGYNNKYGQWMLNLAITSMLITIMVPFDFDRMVQYIAHCYGAISFIIYNGVAMLILFFRFYQKKAYLLAGCASAVILLSTLLLFLLIGESGVLETTPLFLSFLILTTVNFSPQFRISKENKPISKEKELISR